MEMYIGPVLDLLRIFGCDLTLTPDNPYDALRLVLAFLWACLVFLTCVLSIKKLIFELLRSVK